MKGFDRENSFILGFVTLCKAMGAITNDEFKEFFYLLIKESNLDELPKFIWDLIDLDNPDMADIYHVIGFVPSSNLSDSEINAIYGITVKRFGPIFDMPITQQEAINLLDKKANIKNTFKKIFPFIKLSF